jgi:predicted  nucleic acid-binding Zn-ribbon protein
MTTTSTPHPTETSDALLERIREISILTEQRDDLNERLRMLRATLPSNVDTRPQYGPCTRCGHVWRGHSIIRIPRGCPRCGSTGWRIPPIAKNARRPTDPPNPRWGKNRRTGLPADPENVLGRKTRKLQLAAGSDAPTPAKRSRGLTPPPKLEDVKMTLVPPPRIRFAEPSGTSSVAEPGTSIPEAAGSIPASRSIPDSDERAFVDDVVREGQLEVSLLEFVEGDGSILPEGDDNGG